MHFVILCVVKLGIKADPQHSPKFWMGNEGIKAGELFPAEVLLLDCSGVGFYPGQGPGVELSFGNLRVDLVPSLMG